MRCARPDAAGGTGTVADGGPEAGESWVRNTDRADGPIIFAGDHVSHIVAWQEGAAFSALRAVQQVADRVKAAKLGDGANNVIQT